MRFNLKIGQKLSVTAGIGIVLVLALVVMSRVATNAISHATDTQENNTAIFEAALRAQMDWRDGRIAFRDARLANSPAELDRAIKAGDDAGKSLTERFSFITTRLSDSEAKAKASETRDLASVYAASLNEALQAERRRHLARQRLVELGASWDDIIAQLRAAMPDHSSELEALIERLDGFAANARAALWTYHSGEDPQLKARVAQVVGDASPVLKELGGRMPNASALLTKLSGLVTQFPTVMIATVDAVTARNSANKTADPTRVQLGKLIAYFTDSAMQQNLALNGEVGTAISKAETSGLAIGALTILVMIGSAMFGFTGIGRPVRRIAGVLEQIAGGDKSVEVPFLKRGDEVGDTARAADVFKANLIRMEQLSAERAEGRARAEAEKKQAMHELAEVVRAGDRRHHRRGVDRLHAVAGGRPDHVGCGRADQPPVDHRRLGGGGGLLQRADRGLGGGGAGDVGVGDRPPRQRVRRRSPRKPPAMPTPPRRRWPGCRMRRRRSATSSG